MIRPSPPTARSAPPTGNELAGALLELGRLRMERDQALAQVVELAGRVQRLEELIPDPPPREGDAPEPEPGEEPTS